MADGRRRSQLLVVFFGLLWRISSGHITDGGGSQPLSAPGGQATFQSTESRQLFAYRMYRDVQILHYSVPELTSRVNFQFKSNATQRCQAKEVILNLQHGGYPVVNPENTSYPPLLLISRDYFYTVSLYSDEVAVHLNLSVPLPGDWFAVAYLNEDTDKIVQKGLFRDCSAWLRSSVQYYADDPTFPLVPAFPHQALSHQQHFRFYAPENSWSALISVSKCSGVANELISTCPILLYARARALAGPENHDVMSNCTGDSPGDSCELTLVVAEASWNYIFVQGVDEFQILVGIVGCQGESEGYSEVADVPQFSNSKLPKFLKPKKKKGNSTMAPEALRVLAPPATSCWHRIPLARNNLPGNFAFRFDQVPNENGSTPMLLNVSSHYVSLLKFDLMAMVDSGGTLAIEILLDPLSLKNVSWSNVSVSGCLHYSVRPPLSDSGECLSGMSLQVNDSARANKVGAMMIPYPQAGPWYLSLLATCYTQDEHNMSTPIDCEDNVTSVLLQIKSNPCILGQCGHYGNCYQYTSGGFIFSTCVCKAGWKGWGCTDNRDAQSDGQLLLAVLLLTLSNVVFLPAIVLALYRRYFTEALVYLATMFFSTMYHACDSEVYSVCLLRLSVLQFCDFYSAILAVWVTLMAMAELPTTLLSLAHMAGAVGVALGVEYDRTGLWVFVVPVTVGLIIMLISWVHHCSRQHSCYPRGRTWLACLLPGVVTAGGGLALFAFLETRSNYQYVHSGWHAAMALSVLFLLPERRKAKGNRSQVNTCSYVRVEELSDISPSPDYEASEHLLPH